ncbi:beta-1,3-galactosyl-O-glycosyl-glycoprotein beta-1,6-N-acetylglucosaminyltransferase-like [Lineus longissimus]|uniref:beta-1,3-galactosyl-O-glycosyl-glycoprotein beta-1,6-N-acetylglucosaminyltransferase-like n=1 Tax=Lineus longissimus TaxID=88925 RepID=UPI002B4CF188
MTHAQEESAQDPEKMPHLCDEATIQLEPSQDLQGTYRILIKNDSMKMPILGIGLQKKKFIQSSVLVLCVLVLLLYMVFTFKMSFVARAPKMCEKVNGDEIIGTLRDFAKILDKNLQHLKGTQSIAEETRTFFNSESKIRRHLSDRDYRIRNFSYSNILDYVPEISVKHISCPKLFKGEKGEQLKAIEYMQDHPKMPIPDRDYVSMTMNCEDFRKKRGYITHPMSKEEEEFPLAYSILMYKQAEQVERLLRVIYRPQNYYCIHVDKKSSQDTHDAMKAIASCFDNVFIASRSIDVWWGWFSVLEADLVCMQNLWQYKKWKYFINLTGQELPLKTNGDLVKILKTYAGANDIDGTVKQRSKIRTSVFHFGMWPTPIWKPPTSINVTLTKGAVHITASRAFVDYVLHNATAKLFLDWVKNTGIPDETFFTSLHHSPQLGVPGAFKGEPEPDPVNHAYLTRFKNWGYWPYDYPCAGKRVRWICIFSTGDLPLLASRYELFANKFHMDYEPLTYECMEELLFTKTREEYSKKRTFNTTFYSQLPFVKNSYQVPENYSASAS